LKEYTLSTIPKRQEQATSWLLSLLGFRNVYFNQFEKQDQRLVNLSQYTVDIIAQYNDDNLLAIDCVTDIPSDKDINQAKNAAISIEECVSKTVIPMIFSSQSCEVMKQKSQALGVFIIDQPDISRLCDIFLIGHSLQARNLFAQMTQDISEN
jgi:hypothetical protein